ncbi:MAG: hypothetical protein Tsb0015_13010 [Simkaniaceae bacterium]
MQDVVQKHNKESNYLVESAGIDSWFLGDDPDPRMKKIANQHGIFMRHKARLFQDNDFYQYDYIFAVNHDIYSYLLSRVPTKEMQNKIFLATDFSTLYKDEEIPDPYYGNQINFEKVFTMIKETASSIFDYLENKVEKKATGQ